MKRFAVLAYGLISYAVFFATFLYSIGFIGNVIVPKSIDSIPTTTLGNALLINLALLAVFAVQHSLMARPFFKRWWTRIVHPAAERSTYVLFSSLALALLFAFWQPMGGVVWALEHPAAVGLAYGAYAFGWLLVLFSTCAINHFDLFGLRQSWAYFRGREPEPLKFVQPWIYRIVRHPLYVGWLFVFWATPTMTLTHLVFALATSAYILIAIQLEERDLAHAHPEYSAYKRRVPMLVPSLRKFVKARLDTAEAAR